jgi:hypothetical protein
LSDDDRIAHEECGDQYDCRDPPNVRSCHRKSST